MAKHNDVGRKGEEVGAQFLMRQGFAVLSRNKHFGKKEIDILTEKDNIVRVVEVKTVEGGPLFLPTKTLLKTRERIYSMCFVS